MTIWQYLRDKIKKYGKKIVFADRNITYEDILAMEVAPIKERNVVLCDGDTKVEQALKILRCIASHNIAIPITKQYGLKEYYVIKKEVDLLNEYKTKDLAFLMFTSGTSGKPKGVMLSNENIISNLEYINSYFRVEGLKSICISRSLTHISALVGEFLYALCKGLTIYFYEEPFMPQRMITYFNKNLIDVFCSTPTIYRMLAKCNNKLAIKVGVLSGERLTEKVSNTIAKVFPFTKFYNVYGLTEHSPRVSALLPHEFNNKPGSVGKPDELHVKVSIVDGELLVKSKSVMLGYYLDKKKTREKIQNGWLHTGDRAHFDSDGYLYIDGRIDNMLIYSGINFYPEQIEEVVREIEGVVNCIIFMKEKNEENIICMKYLGDIVEKDLRKLLVKILNPNLVPKEIIKVEEIAMTESGKTMRNDRKDNKCF